MTWYLWWLGFWQMLPYFAAFFLVPGAALVAVCYRHDARLARRWREAD